MKRVLVLCLSLFVALNAFGQTTLAGVEDGFTAFATALAPTLSYNATVGNNWSDAYIGNFPHFGAGLAVAVTTVPVASAQALFDGIGYALPAELESVGVPVPAAAVTAKLGGFILPFDIGLKAMMIPEEAKTALSGMMGGMTMDYTLIGGNVRFGLVKEGILFPDVSIGAGYNRLAGSLGMTLDNSASYEINGHTIAVTDPDLSIAWTTDSFDFTAQVSKTLLFLKPYAGVGYSLGTSSVTGGLASEILYDGGAMDAAELAALKADMEAAGMDTSSISATGFAFTTTDDTPVFRLYGGVSFELFILSIDTMVIYVPQTQNLGAQAMIRVQL